MECSFDIFCLHISAGGVITGHIPCEIDLIEPFLEIDGERIEIAFQLKPGMTYTLDFLYKVGHPVSERFGVFFFDSPQTIQEVIYEGANLESLSIKDDPPSFTVKPEVPTADPTGIVEQRGTLIVTTPKVDMSRECYGILGMFQPEGP